MRFSGAVLTGGRSKRMGADKALVLLPDRRPLAAVAYEALVAAGAEEVLAIGGDQPALEALGFTTVSDRWPGQGPLAGLVEALRAARHDPVVVLACDLPLVTPTAVAEILGGLADPDADASIPIVHGRPQVLLAAYRRRALQSLGPAFDRGVRAVHQAVATLVTAHPELSDPQSTRDADDPDALARLLT